MYRHEPIRSFVLAALAVFNVDMGRISDTIFCVRGTVVVTTGVVVALSTRVVSTGPLSRRWVVFSGLAISISTLQAIKTTIAPITRNCFVCVCIR